MGTAVRGTRCAAGEWRLFSTAFGGVASEQGADAGGSGGVGRATEAVVGVVRALDGGTVRGGNACHRAAATGRPLRRSSRANGAGVSTHGSLSSGGTIGTFRGSCLASDNCFDGVRLVVQAEIQTGVGAVCCHCLVARSSWGSSAADATSAAIEAGWRCYARLRPGCAASEK